MGLFKRSIAVTSINFNCWRQDFRVKFILLFTALIVFNTLKPVLQYGLDNGAVSTPLLLPLLFWKYRDFDWNTENLFSCWTYFVTL